MQRENVTQTWKKGETRRCRIFKQSLTTSPHDFVEIIVHFYENLVFGAVKNFLNIKESELVYGFLKKGKYVLL